MPVPSGSAKIVTPMDSVARLEVFTDANREQDEWTVKFYFETNQYDEKQVLIPNTSQFGTMLIQRRFGDVKNDPEVIQAMQIMKRKAYEWREQDIANAAERVTLGEIKPQE